MGRIRVGAPTEGTTVRDGADNSLTDPRIIIFDPPVRPCIVLNHNTTERCLIKVNAEPPDSTGTVTNDFDNDSDDDGSGHMVGPLTIVGAAAQNPGVDVSMGGLISVHSVSLATTNAGDDLDNISVVGWPP